MQRGMTETALPWTGAMTKEQRAAAEVARLARLRFLWMPHLRQRERRNRARRAELLALGKGRRNPTEDAELEALVADYILCATGAYGVDLQVLADAPNEAVDTC